VLFCWDYSKVLFHAWLLILEKCWELFINKHYLCLDKSYYVWNIKKLRTIILIEIELDIWQQLTSDPCTKILLNDKIQSIKLSFQTHRQEEWVPGRYLSSNSCWDPMYFFIQLISFNDSYLSRAKFPRIRN